jgi:hypothetical protein
MSSQGAIVAMRTGTDNDGLLGQAYTPLYSEARRSSRVAGTGAFEIGLRCSNALVWLYAGVQLMHSI